MSANAMFNRRNFIQFSVAAGIVTSSQIASKAFAQSSNSEMQLVLLGTQGGPNYNLARGESANLVLVDGQPYLVDCGYGTLRAIIESGVSYLEIAQIFLSHLHDDHSADIAALLGHQWTQGRVDFTTVYGPAGTNDLVEAAILYNQVNTDIRTIDEARSVKPEDMFSGVVISATQIPHRVFEDSRISVHSIENTHFPENAKRQMSYRSLSYRFDSENRSIVFSGDTTYSENLITLAQDADVLVCEAMEVASMRRAFDAMVASGGYADNPEGIWQHIAETHASTEDAGRMANAAGVKLLVLNHLIPGGLQDLPDEGYLEGVRMYYSGEVVIGKDQMVL